jgi:hypothetical protein
VSVAVRTEGNRVIFTNDQGSWHVWLRLTRNPRTGAVVGPGHIGRVRAADGTLVVEDFLNPDYNLNNCQNGGLGSFGCHLARANEHFPDGHVWNYTWNLTSRQDPARDFNFGICRARIVDEQHPRVEDGVGRMAIETALCDMVSFPEPLFLVRHTYAVHADRVEQQIDVAAAWDGSGPPVFVKEPKLTCHSIGPRGGPRYRYLTVFGPDGRKVFPRMEERFDAWSLPDCTKKTQQLGHARRCRLRFEDEHGGRPFNAVMMGFDADGRIPWRGGPGFDRWAEDANGAARLVAACNGAYCLQGPRDAAGHPTLTRNWELGRFASDGRNSPPHPAQPALGVGFHAWEGGMGYMDCLCASRAMPAFGTTYRSWACYSLGEGFVT